jgi:23S rRNA pseudouridine1911/1915/1917 synthase
MHSAPLAVNAGEGGTLFHWYAGYYPAITALRGRKDGEGGLLHRLDYETRGLVLFAKTQGALDALVLQQERGLFTKEYGALCEKGSPPEGFPPAPEPGPPPFTLESAFRPFGPGRREVRPAAFPPPKRQRKAAALDRGGPYITEVLEKLPLGEGVYFRLGIRRGFRHQIRCHLAWLGFPILNDGLYGGQTRGEGFLALKAQGLAFYDPLTGEKRRYGIETLAHEVYDKAYGYE